MAHTSRAVQSDSSVHTACMCSIVLFCLPGPHGWVLIERFFVYMMWWAQVVRLWSPDGVCFAGATLRLFDERRLLKRGLQRVVLWPSRTKASNSSAFSSSVLPVQVPEVQTLPVTAASVVVLMLCCLARFLVSTSEMNGFA